MKRLMFGAGLLATVAVVAVAAAPMYGAKPGGLGVSPTSVAFGSVTVGSSATQDITVSYGGSGSLILQAQLSDTADFQASLGSCGGLVSPEICTFTVTFAPQTAGKKHAQLKISYRASTCSGQTRCWSSVTVRLSGTGT